MAPARLILLALSVTVTGFASAFQLSAVPWRAAPALRIRRSYNVRARLPHG
jgi:hypothetical protein